MMNIMISDQPKINANGEQIGNKAPIVDYSARQEGLFGGGDQGVFDLLLQQLAGMPGDQASGDLIEQLQSLQDQEDEEGTELAMQMLAEMLGSDPEMASTLQEITANNPELVAQLQQAAQNGGSSLEAFQAITQKETTAQTNKAATAKTDALPEAETEKTGGSDRISVETPSQSGNKGNGEATGDLLSGQSQFQNSVNEAKRMLKLKGVSNENTIDVGFVDVEKLQRSVDSARVSKAEEPPMPYVDTKDLTEQLQKSSDLANTQGKDEFVVKLKPDGLGEITVKLITDSDNKITMSLMTTSTQVAKLLSSELGLLRETMKPYHVEVREIVAQADHSSASLGTGANQQFEQAFAGQHGQQFKQDHPNYYYNHNNSLEDAPFPEELLNSSPTYGLDAHV